MIMKDLKGIPYESAYDKSATDFDFITVDDPGETFLSWIPQRITKVTAFEIESFSSTGQVEGTLHSLKCGNSEQLISQPPLGVLRYENIILPALKPGMALTLKVSGFLGKIRPVGIEVVDREYQPPQELCHTTCEKCGWERFDESACLGCISQELCEQLAEDRRRAMPFVWLAIGMGLLFWLGLALAKWTPIPACLSVAGTIYFMLENHRVIAALGRQSPQLYADALKYNGVRLVAPIASFWDYRFGLVILALDVLITAVLLTLHFQKKPDGPLPPND